MRLIAWQQQTAKAAVAANGERGGGGKEEEEDGASNDDLVFVISGLFHFPLAAPNRAAAAAERERVLKMGSHQICRARAVG